MSAGKPIMTRPKSALFSGLVHSEDGQLLETTFIGDEAHYVLLDDGFKRHILAESVDRQVVGWLRGQAIANKEMVSENMMELLGKDDLFTKAMIISNINKIDEVVDEGIPDDARTILGMMGFRVIVNLHGELVALKLPGQGNPFTQEFDDDDL